MKAGLFLMPSHPPERTPYDAQQWDLDTLSLVDEAGYSEAWIGEHFTALWEPNPAPDLLIAFALAWSVRRPDYVPALLLAVAFLLTDLLLQRPPGLWALLALLACENMKTRGRTLRDSTFGAEWLAVSVWLIAILMLNRIVLSLLLVPPPQWSLSLFELAVTILTYPAVVFVTHALMGVRKSAPGDLDSMGNRS